MRQTSIDAYHQIKEDGLLSRRKWQVYDVIYNHGPITAGEVWSKFFKKLNISQNSTNPRVSELEELGVIRDVGIRECTITGKRCSTWVATKNLPVKLTKEEKIKCPTCNGKGHIVDKQMKLF